MVSSIWNSDFWNEKEHEYDICTAHIILHLYGWWPQIEMIMWRKYFLWYFYGYFDV
jgi:hypothetical protein